MNRQSSYPDICQLQASSTGVNFTVQTLGNGIRYVAGGVTFGLGWALTGACPGPLFALWGSGIGVMGVVVLSAMAGAWVYGWLRPRLPH